MSLKSSSSQGASPRICPRYVFEERIQIRLRRENHEVVVGGWTRDISESGIGAFVAEELVQGEQVEIEVPFGKHSKAIFQARVSRTLGTQYGLVFTTMSPEQRGQIQMAVAGKAPLPSPPSVKLR